MSNPILRPCSGCPGVFIEDGALGAAGYAQYYACLVGKSIKAIELRKFLGTAKVEVVLVIDEGPVVTATVMPGHPGHLDIITR